MKHPFAWSCLLPVAIWTVVTTAKWFWQADSPDGKLGAMAVFLATVGVISFLDIFKSGALSQANKRIQSLTAEIKDLKRRLPEEAQKMSA